MGSAPPRMEHLPEKGKFFSGLGLVDVSTKLVRVQGHGTHALQHEVHLSCIGTKIGASLLAERVWQV